MLHVARNLNLDEVPKKLTCTIYDLTRADSGFKNRVELQKIVDATFEKVQNQPYYSLNALSRFLENVSDNYCYGFDYITTQYFTDDDELICDVTVLDKSLTAGNSDNQGLLQ